jgi:hypothetical protein
LSPPFSRYDQNGGDVDVNIARAPKQGLKLLNQKNQKIDHDSDGDFDELHGGVGIVVVVHAVL